MDFIEGLPKSQGKISLFVVVDRLSNFAYFIPLHHPYTARTLATAFIDNIYKLYEMPKTIISDG